MDNNITSLFIEGEQKEINNNINNNNNNNNNTIKQLGSLEEYLKFSIDGGSPSGGANFSNSSLM